MLHSLARGLKDSQTCLAARAPVSIAALARQHPPPITHAARTHARTRTNTDTDTHTHLIRTSSTRTETVIQPMWVVAARARAWMDASMIVGLFCLYTRPLLTHRQARMDALALTNRNTLTRLNAAPTVIELRDQKRRRAQREGKGMDAGVNTAMDAGVDTLLCGLPGKVELADGGAEACTSVKRDLI